MKLPKISFALVFTIALLFSQKTVKAQSIETDWIINSFHSDITLNKDTTVDIVETVIVDFGTSLKHGIYRDIPVSYKTAAGNNLDIRFDLVSIKDENGQSYKYTKSRQGSDIRLKIGDPDKTISGENTYIISYKVQRVIQKDPNAEFYWNVTGNAWPVNINEVTATIHVPQKSIIDTICFTGYLYSTTQDCRKTVDSNSVEFLSSALVEGEGLTVSVLLESGSFIFPTAKQEFLWFIRDNWIYTIPFAVFAFMLRIYWTRGRDRRFRNVFHESDDTITVPLFEKINALTTFEPPKNLSAGEVGVLVDEVANNRDITAIIIDLARRGFIKVKESTKGKIFKKTEFTLSLIGKNEDELLPFEKSTMDLLFSTSREPSVALSKLPKNSYKYLSDIQTGLYDHMAKVGYFSESPQKVRRKYILYGVFVAALGIFVLIPFLGSESVGSFVVPIVSGVIVAAFAFVMPARTPKGRKALMEVVGLKEYIRVGAWRQKVYEKHNFFEEALPYTIAFGMTDKFIKAFESAKIPKPDWYESSGAFNPALFAHSINSFNSSVVSGVAATRPKSASSGGSGFSGGGFSGGGFGGGGGGSW